MLEEKIEALTTAVVALRQTIEANGVGAAGGEDAAPAKKAPAKKAAAKKVTPKHDKDEVAAVMRKAAKEVDKGRIQEYITEQDCADLAELLTKPELFDAAHEFASGMLEESDDVEDEDI